MNETGAKRMLAKTIEVDGSKVCCGESSAPCRGNIGIDYVGAL